MSVSTLEEIYRELLQILRLADTWAAQQGDIAPHI